MFVYLGSRLFYPHILLKVIDKCLVLSFLLTFCCWQARCHNCGNFIHSCDISLANKKRLKKNSEPNPCL